MYKGASKQSPDLKKLYHAGTAPPGSKIAESATAYVYFVHIVYLYHSKIIMLPLEVNKLIDGIFVLRHSGNISGIPRRHSAILDCFRDPLDEERIGWCMPSDQVKYWVQC